MAGGADAVDAPAARRRGRRAGGADTKAALLDAARAVFAEQGFQGATVRAIAARAGVDAAMVNHWFGGKRALFAAIVELPFDPGEMLDKALEGPPETLAERVIHTFVHMWDTYDGRFAALMLSIASQELAAGAMAEFFTRTILTRITTVTGQDRPELRASLSATQIVGLGVVRYVLKLEPLASADIDTVVATIAPSLQRYLTGPVAPATS
jgi:AcrR family transcriptional regulator